MSANQSILTFMALTIGLAVALIAGIVSQLIAEVPSENRDYKDSPPLGFRIVWWPIQWVSFYLNPFISDSLRASLLVYLRKAGLDYSLNPVQFIASRLLCATGMAFICHWVLASFEGIKSTVPFTLQTYLSVQLVGGLIGWLYPMIWLKDRLAARRRELLKTLPFFLDIITLCVEAGLNLQGAMTQAVLKSPKGILRDEFQRVIRDIRAGRTRAESLKNMSNRLQEPSISSFITAIIQAEKMGMSLGVVLRTQADQRRNERFLRAEKLAMEAPVKMLFPLIAFIFPCTFIVLFFPIVMKFMQSGL
ncbi:MAG: type II secretion system F family protein [Pseudomonadota bacterium]